MKQILNGVQEGKQFAKPMLVGEVAKICCVSKKTVLNWIYRGGLTAFTTYGGHYRVWPGDLRKFMVKAGIKAPFEFIEKRHKTILVVGYGSEPEERLKAAIINGYDNEPEIISSNSFTEAMLITGDKKPSLVVLNWDTHALSIGDVCILLKWNRENPCKFVLTSAEEKCISAMRTMFPLPGDGNVTCGFLAEVVVSLPQLLGE